MKGPLKMNTRVPMVGGVPLAAPGEPVSEPELRQRACTELLRQAAQQAGALAGDDPPPAAGVISEAAQQAIERYLESAIDVPEPAERDCRRHFAAHAGRYARGERVQLRHVLFAVTPGVDVNALRRRAEACLIDLRAPMPQDARQGALDEDAGATPAGGSDRFARVARDLSNCPSGAQGGQLGWLTRDDCAPEFAAEVFGRAEVGVLPRLVHSRFGLHVVEVLAREPGVAPEFESVRAAVAQSLRQQAFATGLRQLLQLLAARTTLEGVELDRATTPLVQ
jgi:peptidyl-prolyl cis-trans isomerase C